MTKFINDELEISSDDSDHSEESDDVEYFALIIVCKQCIIDNILDILWFK